MRRALVLAVPLMFALVGTARADEARATQLFDQGRQLARDGRCGEAIPVLLESVKEVPGVGALLNLGLCYESAGKTATAHGYFVRAEELAASRGDPRTSDAHERATALQPKLSRLTVRVSFDPSSEPDLSLRLDGEPLARERWNVAQVTDPGVHVVEATSSRRRPATVLRVNVRTEADSAELLLPPLVSSPPPDVPKSDPPDEPRSSGSTQRVIGWALGGVVAGALAVGGVFGIGGIVLVLTAPNTPSTRQATRSRVRIDP